MKGKDKAVKQHSKKKNSPQKTRTHLVGIHAVYDA